MAWVYLLVAGVLEVGWAYGLKVSEGFSKPLPSVLTIIGMVLSFLALSQAIRTLPLGTAYAIWTGIGAVGTVIVGILIFREPADAARLICVGLIIAGVIGLRVVNGH
jgi:quaternary ammonium compound-resistance protein SugE